MSNHSGCTDDMSIGDLLQIRDRIRSKMLLTDEQIAAMPDDLADTFGCPRQTPAELRDIWSTAWDINEAKLRAMGWR